MTDAKMTVTESEVWDAYDAARYVPRELDRLAPNGEDVWVERLRVFAMLDALGVTVVATP